ncbi:hypothetical protein BBP40_011145 [Aspergillus hancockii]|nr:hypothetical protein BBP40_011145 [Aspergillus hancockii]
MDPYNHIKDGFPRDADHLCVLFHGFLGSPSHMDHLAASLSERFSDDRLHILVAKRNAGNLTYDGIEVGGERVAHEIEETIDALADMGCHIRKLSVVGYSFGGLVARYAIGLLYARGWLDKLEPVNFTTFVSPHVGVQNPVKGIWSYIWNNIGPHEGSISGQQLFMTDSFGELGRPMLSILADPDSIFVQALKRFKNRCLYANVVNDRTTLFYTTAFSTVDPFRDLENTRINYVEGYGPVVINHDVYFLPSEEKEVLSLGPRVQRQISRVFTKVLFWIFIVIFILVILPLFLLHSFNQTFHSRERVRLHDEGKSGTLFGQYRLSHTIMKEVQTAIEEAYEDIEFRHASSSPSPPNRKESARRRTSFRPKPNAADHKPSSTIKEVTSTSNPSEAPTDDEISNNPALTLTRAQLSIISSLNAVGFRKYPVYIHNHRHSHAAIIVRATKAGFDEGKVVIKHWLDNEFQI